MNIPHHVWILKQNPNPFHIHKYLYHFNRQLNSQNICWTFIRSLNGLNYPQLFLMLFFHL